MLARLRLKSDQRGQATLEFALSMIFLMAVVLFFVQLALVSAWGNYVQYATFLSARAYLSASETRDDQVNRATAYAERMLKRANQSEVDRYPFIAKGLPRQGSGGTILGLEVDPPIQFSPKNRAQSWMEGVRYTFRSRIFMMPLAGKAEATLVDSPINQLDLTSESWLGREPSTQECMSYMRKNFGESEGKDWVIDNGC